MEQLRWVLALTGRSRLLGAAEFENSLNGLRQIVQSFLPGRPLPRRLRHFGAGRDQKFLALLKDCRELVAHRQLIRQDTRGGNDDPSERFEPGALRPLALQPDVEGVVDDLFLLRFMDAE